jgi:tetratricopeptide (TPR) repeat protein/predicted Ser/Thr protein kinase
MIGQSLGRYRILEEIGSGGMGVVYRARDENLERDVALKVLPKDRLGDETARKRFQKEAKSLSKLNHPNIATVHDFGTEEGVDYLVMEYITGETLEDWLQRGALDESEVVRLGIQLVEGLSAAHERGVIHRDLKPGNLRITQDGRLKILDLGLALMLQAPSETATTDSRLTGAQAAVGTIPYMAPEQLRGELADERTDIYAAGAVLYEMATGQRPFHEKSGAVLISAILTQWPATPRELKADVSTSLEKVILKALDKQRDHRYRSAQELLGELQKLGPAETATVALSPPFLERAREMARAERPVFVAREDELASLEGYLDRVLSGEGRVVFVTGEAGSGKTALVNEFVHRPQVTHGDLIVANGNCNAHTGISDPYLPFREVLSLLTGGVESRYRAGAISSEHATRLWHCLPVAAQTIAKSGADLVDTFVAGGELVARAKSYAGDSEWLKELREIVEYKAAMPPDPSLHQSVLFKQYASVLAALAGWKPVLLVLDDLQWADAGSIGLLNHLIEQIQGARLLIIGAYRPEEVATGRDGEGHPLKPVINRCKASFGEVQVEVGRTGGREFVNAYLDAVPNRFSNEFREAFHRHTEGHSLFTTEVLRGLKEQGALVRNDEGLWKETEVDWEKLPTRVEAMIGERIERLPENLREVLTVASVEGEFFTGEVLAGIQKADEREMVRLLSGELDKRHHLVTARGILHEGDRRLSQYRFRHILFQKYLYNSLDEVERAHLHEYVGNVLERLHGEQVENVAVQLARHFQEAGTKVKTIEYLQKAGNKALRLSASQEAATHINKALTLLATLPDTRERATQELSLLNSLLSSLFPTIGYGAPEVQATCERMRTLCNQVGETPQLVKALMGLGVFYYVRGEFEIALEVCWQNVRLAEKMKEPLHIATSHWIPGMILLCLGDFFESRQHLAYMMDYYDRYKPPPLAYAYALDPGVACLFWDAFALWFLGFPDQSMNRARESWTMALEIGQKNSLAHAWLTKLWFHVFRREVQPMHETLQNLYQIPRSEAFYYVTHGDYFQGYVQVQEGHVEEGLAKMLESRATLEAIGHISHRSFLNAHLSEAYAIAGNLEEAMSVLHEAQDYLAKSGEHYYEAEILRLEAESLLVRGQPEAKAEETFQSAIEIARRQQAKSLGLRATMSLARLWQKQGKTKEARQQLAEIYDWFTEGFDTPDLKDAKALLDELS